MVPPYIKLYLHCDITGYCKHLNAIKHSIKLSFIWCEEKQNRTDNCTTTHICITFFLLQIAYPDSALGWPEFLGLFLQFH